MGLSPTMRSSRREPSTGLTIGHFEANYCIAGHGEVADVESGKTYAISHGTLYALDQRDDHIPPAIHSDLGPVCVLNPAAHRPEEAPARRQLRGG